MIKAEIYSVSSGELICNATFTPGKIAPLSKRRGPGKITVRADDPMLAFELQTFLTLPHATRTHGIDRSREDHLIKPGSAGHFGQRLQLLPSIGYRPVVTAPRRRRA